MKNNNDREYLVLCLSCPLCSSQPKSRSGIKFPFSSINNTTGKVRVKERRDFRSETKSEAFEAHTIKDKIGRPWRTQQRRKIITKVHVSLFIVYLLFISFFDRSSKHCNDDSTDVLFERHAQ